MLEFEIKLKDQIITFNDIIDLSEEQQELIFQASPNKTLAEWRNCDKGIKIPLETSQQQIVLGHKNTLVEAKEEKTLLKDGTVILTKHARARVAMRIDKIDPSRPPKPESVLLIIRLVIESDIVDDNAEWKGHKNLVYTLIHNQYNERFKISVSFEKIDDEQIKVITVSNEHMDELIEKLENHPDIRRELAALKEQLLLRQDKK